MNALKKQFNELPPAGRYGALAAAAVFGLVLIFKILPWIIGGSAILLLVLLLIVPYFAPTIIAFRRKHPSKAAILVVNVVFGWTFIAWIASLVWSLSNNAGGGNTVVINNNVASGGTTFAQIPYQNNPSFQAHNSHYLEQANPVYAIGAVVNGHTFDGSRWVPDQGAFPVTPSIQPPAPLM